MDNSSVAGTTIRGKVITVERSAISKSARHRRCLTECYVRQILVRLEDHFFPPTSESQFSPLFCPRIGTAASLAPVAHSLPPLSRPRCHCAVFVIVASSLRLCAHRHRVVITTVRRGNLNLPELGGYSNTLKNINFITIDKVSSRPIELQYLAICKPLLCFIYVALLHPRYLPGSWPSTKI